jgi:AcrR family transcriptional regulator
MSNRQTERTRKALETAFIQLVAEKGYEAVTVSDITERANVGRTTFYRHFQGKEDILFSLHNAFFATLSFGLDSRQRWLNDEPPPQLIVFLEKMQERRQGARSLYAPDKDFDLLVRRIDQLLARQFEDGLRQAFSESEFSIPFSILAQSIAGTYSWLLRWWFSQRIPIHTPAQFAAYIHRLARAAVLEATQLKSTGL